MDGLCACGCGGVTGRYRQNDKASGKRRGDHRLYLPGHNTSPWTEEQVSALRQMVGKFSHKHIGFVLGRSERSVRNKCSALRLLTKRAWLSADIDEVRRAYGSGCLASDVDLPGLAKRLGRDKASVCQKAGELGLTNSKRGRIPEAEKKNKPRFKTKEARSVFQSAISKERIAKDGHPRGFFGRKHSSEARAIIAAKSKAFFQSLTEEGKSAIAQKSLLARIRNGTAHPQRSGCTWRAGWREIGGKRKFYRSRWEANYARYLEWLLCRGEIAGWEHEPETFWFEKIRRGAVSYLPDFRVVERGGNIVYHEVKGWMDARSRTKIARMKKYFPDVVLLIIREKQYKAIERAVGKLIAGWE